MLKRPIPAKNRLPLRAAAWIVALVLGATACGQGLRPTVVEVSNDPIIAEPLNLNLAPAPPDTRVLAPTQEGFPLESSVDDAILAWATDRNIPYVDACQIQTPGPGQYCDSPTDVDTIRLLGPSADEIWWVITVLEAFNIDEGRGFRVASVQIAGR